MTHIDKVKELIDIGMELADDCGSPYPESHSISIAYRIAVEIQDEIENIPVIIDGDYPKTYYPNQVKKDFWDNVVSYFKNNFNNILNEEIE